MRADGPTISLCMIVKNEEQNLGRCLESVQGLVDEIIVVDTGSTDGTVEVARSFGARVLYYRWTDDFAAARNFGLDAASGDWVLVLDADEELHPDDRPMLRQLCHTAAPDVEAFSMVQVHLTDADGILETELCYDVDLWRNRPEYRFESALHEQIIPAIRAARPEGRVELCPIRILHYGFLKEAVAGHRKSERNLRLARRLVEEHPDDAFYRFNLGLQLQGLEDFESAAAEFEQARAGLTWWPDWSAKLFKCLASCLITLRRWEEADAVLRQGISIFPGFTDLVFLRGHAFQEQGDHGRAVVCFRLCIAMGPAKELGAWPALGSHRAYEALARSYAALGKVAEAAEAYRSAFAAKPDWSVPLAGMVEVLSGHLPDWQLREQLAALFDLTDPGQRIRLADIFLAGSRPDLALTLLDPQLAAGSAAARYLQAMAFLRLERYGEALAALPPFPTEVGRSAAAVLLVALACHHDRYAPETAVAEHGLELPDVLEAARLCQQEASRWERRALRQ